MSSRRRCSPAAPMPRPQRSCKSADTALATISWDIAAAMLRLPDVAVVSGQVQAPQGGADIASRRGDDPGAPPRRRPRRRRPAGAPGTRAGPRDRRADVGKAAHRQSRDLSRRRPRDHRQGADLDALLARPRAGVAGAHPRGDRRRRRQGGRERRAPRAAAGHARGAEGGDAPLPAGAHHDAPRRAGHDAGPGDDQGRDTRSSFRSSPCTGTGSCGRTRTASSLRASRQSARPSMRARNSCRSASGRAPASAAPSP